MTKPKSVREPVQVYLDAPDRALLNALSLRASMPRSEVLRLALRRMSTEWLGRDRPGSSLSALVGALDDAPAIPVDLSVRHDDYLYGNDQADSNTGSSNE